MSEDKKPKIEIDIMKWVIGIIGVFILPPIMSFILGICSFAYAAAESQSMRKEKAKLYGMYLVLAGLCSYIVTMFRFL